MSLLRRYLVSEPKINNSFFDNILELRINVVSPENVLLNLNLSKFDALLNRDKSKFVCLFSKPDELFFVIFFVHESGDSVDHFGDCAESIAEAVLGKNKNK